MFSNFYIFLLSDVFATNPCFRPRINSLFLGGCISLDPFFLYQLEVTLSLKYKNSFKSSCFDCFIYSKYYTGIFLPESSGNFYIRSFSYIYIVSFAPASSIVQSRQLMLLLSVALASREVLQDVTALVQIFSKFHI
jgi:hypothetical protein